MCNGRFVPTTTCYMQENNVRKGVYVVSFFFAVLKLLLEKVCTALTNIPEEAIFPLIDFSGKNVSLSF